MSHVTFQHDTSKQTQRTPPSSSLLAAREVFDPWRCQNVISHFSRLDRKLGFLPHLLWWHIIICACTFAKICGFGLLCVGQHLYAACTFRQLKVKWQHPRGWFWLLMWASGARCFYMSSRAKLVPLGNYFDAGPEMPCAETRREYLLLIRPIAALVICAEVRCGKIKPSYCGLAEYGPEKGWVCSSQGALTFAQRPTGSEELREQCLAHIKIFAAQKEFKYMYLLFSA